MHTAIIMDGNGRWATQRGLPRIEGHRWGADAVRRTVEAAARIGINDLSLYAFSSDNWKRPADEVGGLMSLFAVYLESEVDRCRENGIRISIIGRRERLAPKLRRLIEDAEAETRASCRMHLRVAIDYSSRDTLVAAAQFCSEWYNWTREGLSQALAIPNVDLLIRTGGEQRLSDFLLWECAYAELVFLDCMWPDFSAEHLAQAVSAFHARERRFGAAPAA